MKRHRPATVRTPGRPIPTLVAAGFILVASGCTRALPNVHPFVEATGELRSAIDTSGSIVAARLRGMDGGADYAAELAHTWEGRRRAANALVLYSLALNDIAEAGNGGAVAVERVAGAVENLTSTVGLAIASPLLTAAVDAGGFVYGHIAAARASHELVEALDHTQPAVDSVVRILAADISDLDAIVRLAHEHVMVDLYSEYQVRLGFRDELLSTQTRLYARGAGALTRAERDTLLETATLLAGAESWFGPFTAALDRTESDLLDAVAVIHALGDAVSSWGRVHRQLADVFAGEGTLDVSRLMESARDVRELVGRVRAGLALTGTGVTND